MPINKNARVVLEKRYLARDEKGVEIETVEGLFDRVATAVANSENNYNGDFKSVKKSFYDMMYALDFLPNSPTLMNAGRPLGQLSACFVLPIADSMEEIFETIKNAALIHKSGGGTGFSFSRLRSKGATVNSTGGVASGPISFMKVFNAATEAVKQGGTRRGANMGILRIDHPDIMEFIECKKDNSEITNFNISVGITEEFMKAVEEDRDYDLFDPYTKAVVSSKNAKDVFQKIVDFAWKNGEPGIIFLDRLNRDNIVPKQGEIESTNPCGEQPLLPYESCNLGSVNLVNMLKKVNNKWEIDWEKLKTTVKNAVHFLDNVIDANKYPLKLIDETTKLTRKVGLGVMGWADMLLRLSVPYNSDKAIELGEKIMKFINEEGKKESNELAKTRGAFPLFNESIFKNGEPIRNGTISTIAPTGTLSIIAGCSSGVEPVFGYVFIRNVMDGTELVEANPILKEVLEERGLYTDELMKKISKEGSLAHIDEIPQDMKDVFVCAHDVSPEYHIKMQAAFQKYTDNAVSKTVNFPNSASCEDVAKVYKLAYETGCKGVTIYRDGSRDEQVLNIGKVNKKEGSKSDCENCDKVMKMAAMLEQNKTAPTIQPRSRPDICTGFTEKMKIGCGNLYVTVNYDEQGLFEVFTNNGKAGGCPSQSEATARLISLVLRSGIDANSVIDQLKGIRCPSTIRQQGMKATSCPDGIARVIKQVLTFKDNGKIETNPIKVVEKALDMREENIAGRMKFCPECGTKMEHEGGCVICRNCGFSKCG